MSSEHLSESGIYHTDRHDFQRYVATDTASALHVLLWSHGVPDASRRAIVREVLSLLERGRERRCTSDCSTK
jgi:hypothetical protein